MGQEILNYYQNMPDNYDIVKWLMAIFFAIIITGIFITLNLIRINANIKKLNQKEQNDTQNTDDKDQFTLL